MPMNLEQDFVLKTIESRDVHFVRFWFTDVLGHMKSFAVIPSELDNAFQEGMGFDGSCIEGFSQWQEADMLAFPDPSTFQVLPWRPQSNAVARMICSVRTPDGRPFEGDPRYVLERQVRRATEVLDRGGFFDLTSLDYASDLRRDTVLTLENMGIPVEYSHHEKGPSQNEIDLRYDEALSMADAVMTYKMVVKEIALKHGVYASFMPKPMADQPGSGMHVHQSLFYLDGGNAFFDPDNPAGYGLSDTAKHYLAGILKYAPEFCLVTNQYVNSYKRLAAGGDAPVAVGWSRHNRSTLVRVPSYRPNSENASRIELRSPDPSANPYLAFAAMLAAGLSGIEQQLPLEPPCEGDSCPADGVGRRLPESLGEAVELFANSQLMREAMGPLVHDYLVQAKRREWEEYQAVVTPWERDRFLAVL